MKEARKKRAVVFITPIECPTGDFDCWPCPYFGSVDPDNVGEPVIVCNQGQEKEEEL